MKLALGVLMVASCSARSGDAPSGKSGDKTGPRFTDATQVTLRFTDASVPPEFHRSYRITATKTSIKKVVDSYGKVVAEGEQPFDAAGFARVLDALNRHGIEHAARQGDDRGCTGGTSHSLEVVAGTTVLLSGSVYHCGGSDTGDLAGDIKAFAAEVERLAPSPSEAGGPAITPAP